MSSMPLLEFVVLALVASGNCQLQDDDHMILVAPEATSAPLGSNASFYCIVQHAEIRWRINGLNIPLDDEQTWRTAANITLNGYFRGDTWSNSTVTAATLLVTATQRNNRTVTIACSAFGGLSSTNKQSPNVRLTVYGLPLAPGEVEVRGDTAHQLRLSWPPPFTLPGETVSYSLIIKDQTTGERETVASLTDTNYTHTLSESEALVCHPFLFSVFSVNDVGLSLNSSSAPPSLHPSVPKRVEVVTTEVFYVNNHLMITLVLQIPSTCIPVRTTLLLVDDETATTLNCSLPDHDSGSVSLTVAAAECGVRENVKYSVTVGAVNRFQLSSSSQPVTLYTTDVQQASVEELVNSSLLLTCVFARGSRAQGCQLTIQLSQTGKVSIVVQLLRENTSLEITELYKSAVVWGVQPSLLATDIEADGVIAAGGIRGNVTLLRTRVSSSGVVPTVNTTPRSDTNTDVLHMEVLIPVAIVTGVLLVLVLTTLTIIIYRKSRKRVVRSKPPSARHVYEDVPSMSFNPRYLAHKLNISEAASSDVCDGVHNPLQCSPSATEPGIYSYVECGRPLHPLSSCTEADVYEVMKPSGSIKIHKNITTTDNVQLQAIS